MQDRRLPAGLWASVTRVRRAPGHVLQDALYRNGHARLGLRAIEPDSGDLPKWAEDQTGSCWCGRTVSPFRTGSAHAR